MILLLTASLLIVLFFFLIGLKASQWLDYLELKKPIPELPMAPNSHWLYGHLKILYGRNFPTQLYQICHDHANEYGQTGYWLAAKPAISVLNLQDARTVLLKESYRAVIPVLARFISRVVGKKTLVGLNGRECKSHRDAVTRTFVPAFLEESQKQIQQVARDLVKTLLAQIDQQQQKDGTKEWQVDIQRILKLVTFDVLGRAAFSTDFGGVKTLKPSPIVQMFEYLIDDLTEWLKSPFSPWNYFFQLPTERNRRQQEYFRTLRDFIQVLLSQAKNDDKNTQDNLLTRLAAAHGTYGRNERVTVCPR